MSLIKKIFIAFFVMIAVAVVIGYRGLSTVNLIDGTLNRIIAYELPVDHLIGELGTNLQVVTVTQRTLLDANLPRNIRDQQRSILHEQKNMVEDKRKTVTGILADGVNTVSGWREVQDKWNTFQGSLKKWNDAVDANLQKIDAWEHTTILNPDALLSDVMRYRGDHLQLSTSLGEMIAEKRSIGADLNPSDSICNFGRMSAGIQRGEGAFSGNPRLRQVMLDAAGMHRVFHESAARTQALIKAGFDENHEAIVAAYQQNLGAVRSLVDIFNQIAEEADLARVFYLDAETFTMGEMRDVRAETLVVMDETEGFASENMNHNLEHALADGAAGVQRMKLSVIAALVLGSLIALVLYVTIRKQLVRPLAEVIGNLSSNADEVGKEAAVVADSSGALSQGAENQTAALERTSTAIEEITAMARTNLNNSKHANQSVRDNAGQVQEANGAVKRMSTAMDEIQESSEKIREILKTIESIAFQTNLLALNAAVEAARAGEAGKGFAVVADEVRSLAGRSAQAVRDTAELIETTVSRVRNGTEITEEIEDSFKTMEDTAMQVSRLVDEIDKASAEQTLGLEQVNQAVSEIDVVNQQNTEHSKSNAEASDLLNARSRDMIIQVESLGDVLRTIMGGTGLASRGIQPPPNRPAAPRSMKALPPPK